eukprot:4612043-Lingulodinium_polyedra.AAC.1
MGVSTNRATRPGPRGARWHQSLHLPGRPDTAHAGAKDGRMALDRPAADKTLPAQMRKPRARAGATT